jgi:hypothetical protein
MRRSEHFGGGSCRKHARVNARFMDTTLGGQSTPHNYILSDAGRSDLKAELEQSSMDVRLLGINFEPVAYSP